MKRSKSVKKAGEKKVTVHVSYAFPRRGLPAAPSFRHWVNATLRGARYRRLAELSLKLVGTEEACNLNQRYRGKSYATNILSFSADFPKHIKQPLLGDLVICAPLVAHEAVQQNKLLTHHYAHLTVHGVLHLLGYDHETVLDAECMETLERRILASCNIADPYV